MKPSNHQLYKRARLAVPVWAALLLLFLLGCAPVQIGAQSFPADTTELSLRDAGVVDTAPLQRLRRLTRLDLRGNVIANTDFDALQTALPCCEILWSVPLGGTRIDSDNRVLVMPDFSAESAAQLAYFPDLQEVDATGSRDYAALRAAAARYPACTFHWTVPVGAAAVPCTATGLRFSDPDASFSDVETAFSGLPQLRRADLTETALNTDDISRLMAAFPGIEMIYRATFGRITAPTDAASIDLTGCGETDAEALCRTLQFFADLRSVRWADCPLKPAAQLRLCAGFPNVYFDWPVAILEDVTVYSSATELILSDHPVTDLAALEERLPLFPRLERLELCNCGPDDESLAALRARHPDLSVVWMLHIGGYDLRTDARAFTLGHTGVFPGGRFRPEANAGKRYTSMSSRDFAPLEYAADLIALDIGHAESIESLAFLEKLPQLRFLIIALVAATDLSPVASLHDLEYLEVFSTNVTDFSPIADCKKLQYLNLCNTSFADPDVIAGLRDLKRLWVGQTRLSAEDLDALQRALPDCNIEWRGRHPTDRWRIGNEGYFEMQDLFGLQCLR